MDLQTRELQMTYYVTDKDGVIIYAEGWDKTHIEYKIRISWHELKNINYLELDNKDQYYGE